jgi:hypothetical protein
MTDKELAISTHKIAKEYKNICKKLSLKEQVVLVAYLMEKLNNNEEEIKRV